MHRDPLTTGTRVAVLLRLAGEPSMQGAAVEPVPLNQRDAALLAWLAIEGPTARAIRCASACSSCASRPVPMS